MEPAGEPDGHVPEKFMAGRKLLDKFTAQWEHLHRANESNIKKSKLAIQKINTIDRSSKERMNAMDIFMSGYKALSELEQQINSIACDLSNLESSFIQIEELLSGLANTNERASCERPIHEHRTEVQTGLDRDRSMSENLRRRQDFERSQEQALEERREILAKEFEADKIRYLEKVAASKKVE